MREQMIDGPAEAKHEQGFLLTECLVAIAITLLVASFVYGVLVSAARQTNARERAEFSTKLEIAQTEIALGHTLGSSTLEQVSLTDRKSFIVLTVGGGQDFVKTSTAIILKRPTK